MSIRGLHVDGRSLVHTDQHAERAVKLVKSKRKVITSGINVFWNWSCLRDCDRNQNEGEKNFTEHDDWSEDGTKSGLKGEVVVCRKDGKVKLEDADSVSEASCNRIS